MHPARHEYAAGSAMGTAIDANAPPGAGTWKWSGSASAEVVSTSGRAARAVRTPGGGQGYAPRTGACHWRMLSAWFQE